MNFIKSIFPLSFGAKDNSSFVTLLIICIIGMVGCSVIGWLVGFVPVIGFLARIVLWIADTYFFITLIIGILVYLKVLS